MRSPGPLGHVNGPRLALHYSQKQYRPGKVTSATVTSTTLVGQTKRCGGKTGSPHWRVDAMEFRKFEVQKSKSHRFDGTDVTYVKNGGKLYCHGHWTSPMFASRRVHRHASCMDHKPKTCRTCREIHRYSNFELPVSRDGLSRELSIDKRTPTNRWEMREPAEPRGERSYINNSFRGLFSGFRLLYDFLWNCVSCFFFFLKYDLIPTVLIHNLQKLFEKII